MRTTIRLDEDLLRAAKAYASQTGKTLTAVIADSLRESLARYEVHEQRERVCLVTVDGEGLQPGVDLDDSANLLDLMEGESD